MSINNSVSPLINYSEGPLIECPKCGLISLRVILDSDNKPIHNSVGACSDQKVCRYSLLELDYLLANQPKVEPAYIPYSHMQRSLDNDYINNYLVIFLNREFGSFDTHKSFIEYNLGTSLKHSGASVFWYVDRFNNICDGFIKTVNPQTGTRIGDQISVYKLYYKKNERPEKCFFGEHLVDKYPEKLKAIAKDEIEALIGSIVYPKYLWLASSKHIRKEERDEYWPETIWYPEAGFEKLRNFSDRSRPLQFWPREGNSVPYSLNVIRKGL